jgi:hypothetical protein
MVFAGGKKVGMFVAKGKLKFHKMLTKITRAIECLTQKANM